jgi:ribose 5-phosphate isomerase A
LGWREAAKQKAAHEAVKHVQNGHIVGLGSGSTAAYAIEQLGERVRREKLQILGVPTSYQALMLAAHCGIPITTLDEHSHLDVAIDGADQVDNALNLIKGMGGALTREKIVASAASQFIVIADETKLVKKLGTDHPVPVEVLPFALSPSLAKMHEMNGQPIVRDAKGKVGPLVTDNGNFIVDVDFGPIDNPAALNSRLKLIPGVVETGLFVGMTQIGYIGTEKSVKRLQRV